MSRVQANDVERDLALASAEARYAATGDRAEREAEVLEALAVAAQLRRQPFGTAIVRGLKDKVPREVVTTGFVSDGRRLCLMAYSETQERYRSQIFSRIVGRGRGGLVWQHPVSYHSLWIRENRLERGET